MYVVEIDPAANRVVVGDESDLYRSSLWASRLNFPSGHAPTAPLEVTAKIRYKASEAPASLLPGDGWAEVRFQEPQRAVTPGQAVVFYQGQELVAGGIIETEPPSLN
jgi:tRNA-specific 2-thiouridylase